MAEAATLRMAIAADAIDAQAADQAVVAHLPRAATGGRRPGQESGQATGAMRPANSKAAGRPPVKRGGLTGTGKMGTEALQLAPATGIQAAVTGAVLPASCPQTCLAAKLCFETDFVKNPLPAKNRLLYRAGEHSLAINIVAWQTDRYGRLLTDW